MKGLLENIIASENGDIERFIAFFIDQIKEGNLESLPKF